MKKFFVGLMLLCGAAALHADDGGNLGATTVYCYVTQEWWTDQGATVGMYAYDDNDNFNATFPGERMTPDANVTGLWSAEVNPDQFNHLIFTRMAPDGNETLDWGAKTGDLSVPTSATPVFVITSSSATWSPETVDGYWTAYDADGNYSTNIVNDATYYLTGSFNEWSLGDALAMDGDSVQITLQPGSYSFKVLTSNVTWDGAMGYSYVNSSCSMDGVTTDGQDDNIVVALATAGKLTFRVEQGSVCVRYTQIGEDIYSLLGTSALFGKEWDYSDTNTELRLIGESSYEYVIDSVALQTGVDYEYKVVTNHTVNVREWPSIEGGDNYHITVEESGVYLVLFTFDPNSGCNATTNYLHAIINDPTGCNPIASGTCGDQGDNLTWVLGCDNTLTISGSGAMKSYSGSSFPWYEYKAQIRYAVVNDGVTSLSNSSTFEEYPALESVILPEGITSLGEFTFNNCTMLKGIDLPSTINSLGSYCFSGCYAMDSITCRAITPPTANGSTFGIDDAVRVYVPASAVTAYRSADGWSSFTNIMALPECTIASGTCGDQGDNLTWVLDCDNTLTITGSGAMANYQSDTDVPWYEHRAAIRSVIIGEGVESLTPYAFVQCTNLASATIPSTVNSIGGLAFGHCSSLGSVTIPEGITYIEGYTFTGCTSLSSIEIPASVTRIANEAFSGCTSLGNIYCRGAYPPVDDLQNAFANIDSTILTVFVPSRSLSLYQAADGWKKFSNIRGQDDPNRFTMPLSTEWQFIMLPDVTGDQWCGLPVDSIVSDSTLVWARYIGNYRAEGRSGWQLFDPATNEGRFLCTDAYIVRAKGQGATFTMNVPVNAANMSSITFTYSKYAAAHAQNANWNLVGNPYPYYYNILAQLEAMGITAPITIWNGTGYDTFTPGIDTERMLAPFEAFFIQVPEENEAIVITFSGEYIMM